MDGLVRGVAIPAAGHYELTMTYRPPAFTSGVLVAGATVALLLAVLAWDLARRQSFSKVRFTWLTRCSTCLDSRDAFQVAAPGPRSSTRVLRCAQHERRAGPPVCTLLNRASVSTVTAYPGGEPCATLPVELQLVPQPILAFLARAPSASRPS